MTLIHEGRSQQDNKTVWPEQVNKGQEVGGVLRAATRTQWLFTARRMRRGRCDREETLEEPEPFVHVGLCGWREEGSSGREPPGPEPNPGNTSWPQASLYQGKGTLHCCVGQGWGGVGREWSSQTPGCTCHSWHLSPEDNGGDATDLVIKRQHDRHNSAAKCSVSAGTGAPVPHAVLSGNLSSVF